MEMVSGRIVTQMRLFYKNIELNVKRWDTETGGQGEFEEYSGRVFTGIQFKDHENQLISFKCTTEEEVKYQSDVCGTKNNEHESTWLTIGGPLKGNYAVINFTDTATEYVSDYGMRVDDPCKAHDDTKYIYLTSDQTTVKDLKFH